jgi:hypothetical protein
MRRNPFALLNTGYTRPMNTDELRAISDPVERIQRARGVHSELNKATSDVALVIREAVAELLQTHSKSEVAVMIGVTKGRITQLAP